MRRHKISFLLIVLITFTFSCKKKNTEESSESKYSFRNNFENVLGWNYSAKVLKMEGHSGNYVTYVDTNQIYSHAFICSLDKMADVLPKKIIAKAWVLRKTESTTGQFVAEISNDIKGISWIGVKLKEVVPQINVWTEVKIEIPLETPEVQNKNNTFKVYGWLGDSKEVIYFDDFEILLE